jgi:phospholipid/cholesterol/gamma-HCH transport system substrate-binding protein
METKVSHVFVGIVMLTLLIGAISFGLWLGRVKIDSQERLYRIYFSGAVTGLQVGSSVRFKGVPVGRVNLIGFSDLVPDKVEVKVFISDSAPIKTDSIARLETAGLSGLSFIQISEGGPDSPLLRQRPTSGDGGGSNENAPIIDSRPSRLSELFDNSPQLLNNLIDLSTRVQELLSPQNRTAFSLILANITSLTNSLANSAEGSDDLVQDLRDVSVNLNQLVIGLNAKDGVIAAVGQTVSALGTQSTVLAQELGKLSQMLIFLSEQATSLIAENRPALKHFSQVGLYDLTKLLAELKNTTSALNRLSTRLERDPSQLLFPDTRSALPVALP